MITNFEEITCDLTDDEKKIVPHLIAGFKTHTKANPITAPNIIAQYNKYIYGDGLHLNLKKLSQPRLRKLCNYIRTNSMLPLIATSEGYFVSTDREEIKRQVRSLRERSEAILNSASGLEKFLQ